MKKSLLAAIMMLLVTVTGYAQDITVYGQVLSQNDDEPLIGATIMSIATGNGTATDIDGNFQITVPEGTDLKISYVGYTSQTVEAIQNLTVYLYEDSEVLDEVVVVGYQTVKKADLTGAVSVVSTKSLETSADTDPMRSLQGKIPGMTVTADGSPAGTGTVRIRGIGSFNASQDPLFVIDGVPTTSSLNSLNMNDIESMQVLRAAASA
ncbi:MAG: TonB-dependent receptor plug domain-containing protein, partial [Muribaculaceae bacterium]|nr:TonB-dependent receptor plug domain-containing protein [Muribaculaceae bacterium]